MELSGSFLKDLKAYDPALDAYYDGKDDAIYIWAYRQGMKIHELTIRREYGELYPELERRALRVLPQKDVWRRFGSGKAYDDYLAEEEEKLRRKGRESFRKERMAMWKDNRRLVEAAIWNAQHGRMTKKDAIPYTSPQISLHIEKSKESEK